MKGHSVKHRCLRLALAVAFLILGSWPRASGAEAAMAGAVVVWGAADDGQTTVPIAAQSGVTAIAAGISHTMALTTNGSVVEWLQYCCGESAVPVEAQSGVTAIAAGGFHRVALKSDGSIVLWGTLSDGNRQRKADVPVGLSGVVAIAAGLSHTAALKTDGSVLGWGYSNYGQTNVPATAQNGVTAIAAGYHHTLALKTDGSVVAWGDNRGGQTNVPVAAQSGVTAISAGSYHSVALRKNGTVVVWGSYLGTNAPSGLSGVTAIAAGNEHTTALLTDGTVAAWGYNAYGQVTGTPTTDYANASPVTLGGQVLSDVMAIAAGEHHTAALVIPRPPNITKQPVSQAVNVWQSPSFTVAAAGHYLNYQWRKDGVDIAGATNATCRLPSVQTNQAGGYTVVVSNSIGSVTSAPPAVLTVDPAAAPGTVAAWRNSEHMTTPIAAQSGVTAIAAGGHCFFRACDAHTVALKSDGSVVAWGSNDADAPILEPRGVTAIAAGWSHAVALKNDGTVLTWEWSDQSEATDTPTTDGDSPPAPASAVTLEGQVLSGVTAIAAGAFHIAALKNDGSVVTWENSGQTPVPAAAQSGVTAIAAGWWRTAALKNDGSVVVWGSNEFGEVTGTPSTEAPYYAIASPVTLGGQVLSGVTAIALGRDHTVALKNDGSVVAWGGNGDGQLAIPLAAQSGVTAIAAGWSHTVALKDDGTTVTWGTMFDGTSIVAATAPAGLSGVTAIAAGPSHTVALIGGVPPLPFLNAKPNGNQLILSWPAKEPAFTLQSTLDLTPPVTWLDSTSVPALIDARFTLTNPATGGPRFYRLKKDQR